MLRSRGVKEIHLRIGSPPITHPCFYGIDTPQREQLIAAQKSVAEIQHMLAVDSLRYLSLPALQTALGKNKHCVACFTGNYQEEIFTAV